MDSIDRSIINHLQGGFPICDRPYAEAARELSISEQELIDRLGALLQDGTLSRFGPMYHAERLGGALTLCAMAVPDEAFEQIAQLVNAFPEVAHNYQRDHRLNMWFVLAVADPRAVTDVIRKIEDCTGHTVYNMPKLEEFYVGLRLVV